jgi:multidrug efflux pump subunit AcrA (membrane-fusion protein)
MENQNALKRKRVRNWVIGLIVVLVVVFVALRFNPAQAGNASVEVAGTVVSLNVAQTVEASGSLETQPFASLTWETEGVVEEIYVEAGDQVEAGEVLMKLNTNSVPSSILSSQADLVTAQKELDDLLIASEQELAQAVIDLKDTQEAYDEAANYLKYLQTSQKVRQTETKIFIDETFGKWRYRYKTRVFKGPAPADWMIEAENDLALKKAQLEDAQRAYDRLKDGANARDVMAAQAKIDAARATLNSMSVIAPFAGQVLYVESQPGDVVTTESIALDMADLDHLYIEAQVSEADIADVTVGDPITAISDAAEDLELSGQVAAINPLGEVSSDLVQYTVRIDLEEIAEDESLPLGSTANVTIQVAPASPSLAVPITAVQNDDQGEYVLVIQVDGSTKRADVVSSTIVGDLVVVKGNLKEGDTLARAQNNNFPGGGPFGGPD